eukprot:CAMPEP_0115848672 /NCGR_PEP_ID=MMETSP0287-20121206/11046_1 /TAXON_ID=412157 /ORGANISM="Chrysochromulina rotalis, Strain UIO044" /LENGTH=55 /DNA_ID=CAMNT_0003302599 /DNA_START=751 /DNA_END=915 /DNA_ORIENTATION=-
MKFWRCLLGPGSSIGGIEAEVVPMGTVVAGPYARAPVGTLGTNCWPCVALECRKP